MHKFAPSITKQTGKTILYMAYSFELCSVKFFCIFRRISCAGSSSDFEMPLAAVFRKPSNKDRMVLSLGSPHRESSRACPYKARFYSFISQTRIRNPLADGTLTDGHCVIFICVGSPNSPVNGSNQVSAIVSPRSFGGRKPKNSHSLGT